MQTIHYIAIHSVSDYNFFTDKWKNLPISRERCLYCECLLTSVDANESLLESVLMWMDVPPVDDDVDADFPSTLLSVDFRTAPTRSLAKRDHDSMRLCANQHAAGPRPLILFSFFLSKTLSIEPSLSVLYLFVAMEMQWMKWLLV